MFLPVGDTPNPPGVPYVTSLLIGLNLAVFFLISLPLMAAAPDLGDPLLFEYLRAVGARGTIPAQAILQQLSAYDLFVFRYGFRPGDPSLVALFSSLFLHGGWMHLAGNMLFLWIFGDNVEHRLGRGAYLLAYFGAGVAATLFFALFVPHSQIPLVGASGAISGVLGLYFLWFPRNQVKVFIFLFPFIMSTFLVPARLVLGFYLLIDNLLPFLLTQGGGSGVAHGAHIGGFLAGATLAFGIDRLPDWRARRFERSKDEERSDPALRARQVAAHIGRNELSQAAALYFSLAGREERRRLSADDLFALGDYLQASGQTDRALSIFRRFIAERPADARLDQAYLGAGKALLHKPRCMTNAYHYFLAALDVAKSEATAAEARRQLRIIEGLGEKG